MAEREGFEPPGPFGPMVFKTIAIDHSATSPCCSEDSFAGVAPLSIVFFAEVKYHPDAHGENRDQPPDVT